MKTRRRILDIRRRSRVSSSNNNLWFFSESSSPNQPVKTESKSARNDHISILQEDYDRFSRDRSLQEKSKKKSEFIVDWQMSND